MLTFALLLALQVPFTTRVSLNSAGGQSTAYSIRPSVSEDGRFVAFESRAALTPNDMNGDQFDVYVRDRLLGTTELISVTPAGVAGNWGSHSPRISADGYRVAFFSDASDIAVGDANAASDVFVRDRATGSTTLVSASVAGGTGNGISFFADISADGRFVVYESRATDLGPLDTNVTQDVYMYDVLLGTTTVVSLGAGGVESNNWSAKPAISADGQVVAFESWATNLGPTDTNGEIDIYVCDLGTGINELASISTTGVQSIQRCTLPDLSADGSVVVFEGNGLVPGDTNGELDIYLRDRPKAKTSRVSDNSASKQVSAFSETPSVSGDGRYIIFSSAAKELIYPHTNSPYRQIWIKDRVSWLTSLVSATPAGKRGDQSSDRPAFSGDGHWIVFDSQASDLVAGDTNGLQDCFIYERPLMGPRLSAQQPLPGGLVELEFGSVTPSGLLLLGGSIGDQGPLPTSFGLADLGAGFVSLPLLADSDGELQLGLPPLPGGHVLFVQFLDVTSSLLSNGTAVSLH
jgi:Tol biopolymer transport system component